MSVAKLATIVTKLQNATKRGKVEWGQTEKEGVYEATFPDFAIHLSFRPTIETDQEPDAVDYIVSVYNSSGIMIESVSDIELRSVMNEPYKILDSLYQLAKGYALGTEQTLDSIISTLDEEDIPF